MTDAVHNQHSETRRPGDRDRSVTTGPAVSSPPVQKCCAEMMSVSVGGAIARRAHLARPFGPAGVGHSSAAPAPLQRLSGRSSRSWYNLGESASVLPRSALDGTALLAVLPGRCESARFGKGGFMASDITLAVGDGAQGSAEVSHGTDPRPPDSVSPGTDPLTAAAIQTLSQDIKMLREDVEHERDRADHAERQVQVARQLVEEGTQADRRATSLTR